MRVRQQSNPCLEIFPIIYVYVYHDRVINDHRQLDSTVYIHTVVNILRTFQFWNVYFGPFYLFNFYDQIQKILLFWKKSFWKIWPLSQNKIMLQNECAHSTGPHVDSFMLQRATTLLAHLFGKLIIYCCFTPLRVAAQARLEQCRKK